MSNAALAVSLYVIYLTVAFGLRTAIQLRRTGASGFHGLGGSPGSAEWLAGVGFAVALLVGVAAPLLALLDVVEPISALDGRFGHALGAAFTIAGIAATLHAQIRMGSSWRIGVDHAERTTLVTGGPFALVRNPIFAAMLPTGLGLALLVPSSVAIVGLIGLAVALETQVRVVEEPYLRRVHGAGTPPTRPAWGASPPGSVGYRTSRANAELLQRDRDLLLDGRSGAGRLRHGGENVPMSAFAGA